MASLQDRRSALAGICRAASQPERMRIWAEPIPPGMVLGFACAVPYCGKREHMVLRPDKTRHWNSYRSWRQQLWALPEGGEFTVREIPHRQLLKFRCGLQVNSPHFITRNLPGNKGVRVIRTGDFYGDRKEWEEQFPVQDIRLAAPCNALRPGAFYLGLLAFASLHREDIPPYQHCQVKACAFPANGNGQSLCHHHFHFFDYKMSLLGRYVDMVDIYGDDKEAPRYYVSWFWKHDSEALKFEHRGSTSWWRESVREVEYAQIGKAIDRAQTMNCGTKRRFTTEAEALAAVRKKRGQDRHNPRAPIDGHLLRAFLCSVCGNWHIGRTAEPLLRMSVGRVLMGQTMPGLHRGVSGLHQGKRPPKMGRSVKASQKGRWKSMIKHRIGSKRTPQKPEKRWSRAQLERAADAILGIELAARMPADEWQEELRREEAEREMASVSLAQQQEEFEQVFGRAEVKSITTL